MRPDLAKLTVLTLALALSVALLPACGKPSKGGNAGGRVPIPEGEKITSTSPGTPAEGDWFVQRFPVEMAHLNPIKTGDLYNALITDLIYDSLIERDPETLEFRPRLAESWEVSPDHLVYTFHLRRNAKFSDGAPLTARDAVFTFNKMMDPEVDAADARNYYASVDRIEAVDDYTLRFYIKQPYFKNLEVLGGLPVLPEHVFSTGDFNNHPANRAPVGSGKYMLEKWETNQQVVLTRNPNYWGEKPHLAKFVYKLITDDNAAFQVLEQGGVDRMSFTPDQWVTRTQYAGFDDKFDRYEYYAPQGGYSYIGWNLRRPVFSDKRVRKALTMLLDRELIHKTLMHGYGKNVTNPFFVNSPEYNNDIKPLPYDPAAAQKLLDEAGWKDTNNNGIRDKDGVEFQFELVIGSGSDIAEQIGTVLKESMDRVGINMTIRQLEWATMTQSIHERKFDAYIMGWSATIDQDPYQIWHSSQADQGSNYIGFVNAEADKLLEAARLEFDTEKRRQLYRRFAEIVAEEQPYTFLFASEFLVAIDKRFRNVKIYPIGPEYTEWWVPQELQKYK